MNEKSGEPTGDPEVRLPKRVPVGQLVDLSTLGPAPSLRALRAALPRGWVLDDDGHTARKDLRLVFREGWILILGLVSFGACGVGLFVMSFPRGASGWLYAGVLIVSLLVIGGLVAPMVTRALNRR